MVVGPGGDGRHWWHCGEASHPRTAGPGACAEVVRVELFPGLCSPVQIVPFGCGRRRTGSLAPTSTAVVGWGPVASPATLSWHPTSCCPLLVSLSLAGLGQGPGPAALTWPGHGPSVGLHVHLCTWGWGVQGVFVCVEECSCS